MALVILAPIAIWAALRGRYVRRRHRAELERRELELRRQREFLDAVVTHAPYPIAVLEGPELRYTLANPRYRALVGPDARIVGQVHEAVFPEAAAAGGKAHLLKTFETGEPWVIDGFKAQAPGGPERIWEGRAVLLPAIPGEQASVAVIAWDATEQVESHERLRESEQRYRSLFASMQEGFIVCEVICDESRKPADWRYLQVNEAVVSMWGRPASEIVGRTYREMHPEAASEYWIEAFGRVALSGESARLEHYGPATGRHYQAAVYSPAPGHFAALLTDVSERKKAEEALQESERRYRTLFESMQEAFVLGESVLDAAGEPIDWRYLDVNPAFERMFGRARHEVLGRTYRELFPDVQWQYWRHGGGISAKAIRGHHADQQGG